MQVNVEDISQLTKMVKVVVPAEKVSSKLDEAYAKIRPEVSIKGFRKGKVPKKVLEKNYGERVKSEVAEKLVQDTYFDALEQADLNVVAHPEVKRYNFGEDGTFDYDAQVAVKPEFELGTYKDLEIEMAKLEVTDQEINDALEEERRNLAPLRNINDRGVEEGDIVVVDFQGYYNGEPVNQVKKENHRLEIRAEGHRDSFEDACLGYKAGEESSCEIDFPEDFASPELAGKKIDCRIQIRDVKEKVLPALDDDFARDIDEEFNSLEDLKEHLKNRILQNKKDKRSGEIADKIMSKLLENHDFEVPDRLVAYEVNQQIQKVEEQLKKQDMTLESAGLNYEKLIDQYKENARMRVRGDFIIKKIADEEKISLNDDDMEEGFKRISEQYGLPINQVKQYFQNRDDLLPLMNELLNEKVLDFIKENTVIRETGKGADTEEDLQEEE
ncbi:MAG: trigger factor [Thermodesulfobacteriota bacterium]